MITQQPTTSEQHTEATKQAHPTLTAYQIEHNNTRARKSAHNHGITENDTTPPIPWSPILLLTRQRTGRIFRTNPADKNPARRYGDAISQKHPDSTWIFFQNVKGLTYSNTGEDYRCYLSCLRACHVDIAGLAETNTCWSHQHLQAAFCTTLRSTPSQSKVTFGYPSRQIDSCTDKETFQAGDNLTLVTGNAVSQIHGTHITDKTGLGRWSGITFQGKLGTKLTMITGYRTCNGSIKTSPLGSTYIQECTYVLVQKQRLQSYQDLIITYNDDHNPSTQATSRQKAIIVANTALVPPTPIPLTFTIF